MPNEKTCRLPDFVEGVPIQLEDSGVWHFPKPIVHFALSLDPTVDPGVARFAVETNRRFGPAFWDRQEAFRAIRDEEFAKGDKLDFLAVLRVLMPLAVDLLRRNYKLADDEVLDLLTYAPGDDRNIEMWIGIMRVAMGLGPKPEAAG